MASKSRRDRRKHSLQSKKSRKRTPPVTVTQQQAIAQTYKPAAPSKVVTPAKEPTPAVARFPYIATELRRIGILAGIMLTTLVVLALVLP